MTPAVNVQPCANGIGCLLRFGNGSLWFAHEIHAINFVQDSLPDSEIVVLNLDGSVRHRYASMSRNLG